MTAGCRNFVSFEAISESVPHGVLVSGIGQMVGERKPFSDGEILLGLSPGGVIAMLRRSRLDPPQEALPGGILAIAGPVGFHIQGQGQTGSHHADQDEGMLIAENLFLGIALRTTERTALLSTPSGTGAINR